MQPSDNKPIYIQLADRLMDRIAAGEYPADTRIPSVRELAAEAQVNVNTAMRTFEHLTSLGIIYNRRGLGYFVTPGADAEISQQRMSDFLTMELPYIFSRMHAFGIKPDEIRALYENHIQSSE